MSFVIPTIMEQIERWHLAAPNVLYRHVALPIFCSYMPRWADQARKTRHCPTLLEAWCWCGQGQPAKHKGSASDPQKSWVPFSRTCPGPTPCERCLGPGGGGKWLQWYAREPGVFLSLRGGFYGSLPLMMMLLLMMRMMIKMTFIDDNTVDWGDNDDNTDDYADDDNNEMKMWWWSWWWSWWWWCCDDGCDAVIDENDDDGDDDDDDASSSSSSFSSSSYWHLCDVPC